MEDNRPVMVTIRCTAYNHESFIRQCLDGFVMQKTNFRFEAIVHDDASTDGTADIIREYAAKYPEIIKPIYQTENQYSKRDGTIGRILNQHTRGKYVAMCEGDDYWTDPLKLQKQVDFLESHPDYVVCTHAYRIYEQEKGDYYGDCFPVFSQRTVEFDMQEYIKKEVWLTQPLTALYLYSALDIEQYCKCKFSKDLTLFYYLLKSGKGLFMNEPMGVYRSHANGVWTGANRQERILADMRCILGIYDVEHSDEAAILLNNMLFKSGYLGKKIYIHNFTSYCKCLKIIARHCGCFQAMRVLFSGVIL